MTQENVETMREAYRSFDRGEANLLFDLLHPDIVWEAIEDTEPTESTASSNPWGHGSRSGTISTSRRRTSSTAVTT
jgi:ketosteroid isomerase-like protein